MWELPENSNLTLSAPPACTEFESLDAIAFFKTGGLAQPPCLLHRAFAEGAWQRRRSRGGEFSPGADKCQCSRLRPNARSPTQRLDRWPPRLRDQELHRRVSSMLPVSRHVPQGRQPARRSGSGQPLCGGDS